MLACCASLLKRKMLTSSTNTDKLFELLTRACMRLLLQSGSTLEGRCYHPERMQI